MQTNTSGIPATALLKAWYPVERNPFCLSKLHIEKMVSE